VPNGDVAQGGDLPLQFIVRENRLSTFLIAFLGLTSVFSIGCARTDAKAGSANVKASAEAPAVIVSRWTDIEGHAYEMRAPFFAGLKQLEAKVDLQITRLIARRAMMRGPTETQDWDLAMKEMESARSHLKFMGEETGRTTADTWHQQKAKVGLAWLRTQRAHDKVNRAAPIF
jgi:hypothetical protein